MWDGESLPVPVEDIVDSVYGLLVRDVEDMAAAPGAPECGEGEISGLLFTGPGEIWVNAEESRKWPPRRRFTIGHELGHWVLHNTGETRLYCRSAMVETTTDSVALERATEPEIPLIEVQANAFAAAMLMPAHLMKARYELCDGVVEELMKDFDCSQKAMFKRIFSVVPKDRRRQYFLSRRPQ